MTRVREWKPGDVAVSMGDRLIRTSEGGWSSENGQAGIRYTTQDPRPLVVIDPEDESLPIAHAMWERLVDLGTSDFRVWRHHIREVLNSIADPAPPKPEEPTGLGAVVEDVDGVKWVRSGTGSTAWHSTVADWVSYARIDAVKVLSDGIPA